MYGMCEERKRVTDYASCFWWSNRVESDAIHWNGKDARWRVMLEQLLVLLYPCYIWNVWLRAKEDMANQQMHKKKQVANDMVGENPQERDI